MGTHLYSLKSNLQRHNYPETTNNDYKFPFFQPKTPTALQLNRDWSNSYTSALHWKFEIKYTYTHLQKEKKSLVKYTKPSLLHPSSTYNLSKSARQYGLRTKIN